MTGAACYKYPHDMPIILTVKSVLLEIKVIEQPFSGWCDPPAAYNGVPRLVKSGLESEREVRVRGGFGT